MSAGHSQNAGAPPAAGGSPPSAVAPPPAAPAPIAELRCQLRPGRIETFRVKDAEVVIGREPGLGVTLPADGVSRRHAKITLRGDAYWIENLSPAGTFLNGHRDRYGRLAGLIGRPRRLRHLDVITLAKSVELLFLQYDAERPKDVRFGIKRAALVPQEGPAESVELGVGETVVGRSPAANVVLEPSVVSSLHARIERDAERLVLRDLDSGNGTYVNGERVTTALLRDGDVVSFANVARFRVVTETGEVSSGEFRAFEPSAPAGGGPQPTTGVYSQQWKTRYEWNSSEMKEIAELRAQIDQQAAHKAQIAQTAEKGHGKAAAGKPAVAKASPPPKPSAAAPAVKAEKPAPAAAAEAPAKAGPNSKPAPAARADPAAKAGAAAPAAPPLGAGPGARAEPAAKPEPAAGSGPTAKEAATKKADSPAGPAQPALPQPAAPAKPAPPPATREQAVALPAVPEQPRPAPIVSKPPAVSETARAAAPIREVRLTVTGVGPEFVLTIREPGAHEVGRAGTASLVVDHPTVSRRQARILLAGDRSSVTLEPLAKTKLDDVPLETPRALKDGSVIQAGLARIVVGIERGDRPQQVVAPADSAPAGGRPAAGGRPDAIQRVLLDVKGAGPDYVLTVREPGSYELGRVKSAPLLVEHPTVSRNQARIVLSADRSGALVEPGAGKTPTMLDGAVLESPRPLAEGSVIQVGTVRIEVRLERGPA